MSSMIEVQGLIERIMSKLYISFSLHSWYSYFSCFLLPVRIQT